MLGHILGEVVNYKASLIKKIDACMHVLEETFNKSAHKVPTSPKICASTT